MRITVLALTLAACGSRPPDFSATAPAFDPLIFWTGHSRSWGVIEDRDGAPTAIVTTDCKGTLEDANTLHMQQTLVQDGKVTHRDWHLHRVDTHHFTATANDMAGTAEGVAAGRTFHWTWTWARAGFPGNLTMEQWMYYEPNGSMVNRTMVRKLGLVVAEVTEQFTKL